MKNQSQVDSEELLRRLEEERATIHTEYDQERIAYQKLLKAYNRLEAQFENAQDELRQVRGDDMMSNVSIGTSLVSSEYQEQNDLESSAFDSGKVFVILRFDLESVLCYTD